MAMLHEYNDDRLKQAWDNLKDKLPVFPATSLPFNGRAYHRQQDKRNFKWGKAWERKLPRGVWLRRIKKKYNHYALTVYIEALNREVTVTAEGKTCPYEDLIMKVHVFL